jgi:protein ImuB
MRGRGAGAQRLSLVLEHGRKTRTRVELDFASPERESDFILGIAREKLGRLTLPAATVALSLRADALLVFTPRSSTWLPGAEEQALDSARLLERLAARMGKERVFGIALANDHRPEKDWSQAFPGATARHRRPISAPRPAWLLNRPHRLISQDGNPSYQGELTLAAGPERIEAGWWDGEEVRRDYYVASNPRGETFWIFREHRDPGSWFLHGVFA